MINPNLLIHTLSGQLSNSPIPEERIKTLLPINFIYDYYKSPFTGFIDQHTGKKHSIKWETEEERLKEIDRINDLIKTYNDRVENRYKEITKGLSDNEIFEISRMPGNEDIYEEPNIINPIRLWTIYCLPILKNSAPNVALEYDDINFLRIDNEELYKKIYCDIKDDDQSLVFLNKLIFDYISQKVDTAKKHEIWDEQNIWFKPYRHFINWFSIKNVSLLIDRTVGGRPKGTTKRTIERYKKVFHQFEISKKKYSSKTKSDLYELLATKAYDGKTYSRRTIKNIIEDKKYNLIPSR